MFKLHKVICKEYGKLRLIVVKAGWCEWCNQRHKDKKKQNANKMEKEVDIFPSTKDLKHELDNVFSLYIRLRHADKKGMVECFTSGERLHYTRAEAGHFISRGNMSTRWEERNVQVQSFSKNREKYGNQKVFAKRLDEVYGAGTADELKQKKNERYEPLEFSLQVKITHYRNLVQKLLLTIKNK